jgi:protein arginine N-methyltransferase 2
MATDEDIEALSMLGGYLIFSILNRRPLPKILTLIDAGAPLWYQDDEGTSALHAAACIEDEELVRILIERGAIWNAGECSWPAIPRIVLTLSAHSSG